MLKGKAFHSANKLIRNFVFSANSDFRIHAGFLKQDSQFLHLFFHSRHVILVFPRYKGKKIHAVGLAFRIVMGQITGVTRHNADLCGFAFLTRATVFQLGQTLITNNTALQPALVCDSYSQVPHILSLINQGEIRPQASQENLKPPASLKAQKAQNKKGKAAP
jgi:hypothetical protein